MDHGRGYLDGVIARGLTNRITLEIGRITSLHLGKTALSEVLTTFSSKKMHPLEKEGNLGSKTLCRFRVTFDYRSQRMFLEPTTGYDAPFEFNMAGIQFVRAEEGRFKIERVFPDSPASEAELAEQDLILAVDGRPAGEYTLDELESLFRREGRKVALIVLHEGRTSDIRLKLRRLPAGHIVLSPLAMPGAGQVGRQLENAIFPAGVNASCGAPGEPRRQLSEPTLR